MWKELPEAVLQQLAGWRTWPVRRGAKRGQWWQYVAHLTLPVLREVWYPEVDQILVVKSPKCSMPGGKRMWVQVEGFDPTCQIMVRSVHVEKWVAAKKTWYHWYSVMQYDFCVYQAARWRVIGSPIPTTGFHTFGRHESLTDGLTDLPQNNFFRWCQPTATCRMMCCLES